MLPNLLAHQYQSPPHHQAALVPIVVARLAASASTSSTSGATGSLARPSTLWTGVIAGMTTTSS